MYPIQVSTGNKEKIDKKGNTQGLDVYNILINNFTF